MTDVLLGFEIGTGEPIYMKQRHTIALGMTQAGKTTALEAIISRTPDVKALAFKTKRGESGFRNYRQMPLFYKSRTDWQYIESLLNTSLKEKTQYQPFMRWAVMQVTKGAPRSLREVMQNAHNAQYDKRFQRRKEVFELLEAYLQIVVPELEKYTFSEKLELQQGINVMDISDMKEETQYLIIGACIEYIHENLSNVITIIPEAWDAVPQGRTTPVKLSAEKYIRKGAAVKNILYLDSQDIAGIDKQPLRQCDNWIMGRMKETNEVERLKEYLPKSIRVDSAEDFRTMPLGVFYAVLADQTHKVYVLPAGVPEKMGKDVAMGILPPEAIKSFLQKKDVKEENEEMYKQLYEEEQKKNTEKDTLIQSQATKIKELERTLEDSVNLQPRITELEKRLSSTSETLKGMVATLEKEKKQNREAEELKTKLRNFLLPNVEYFEKEQKTQPQQATQPVSLHVESKVTKIEVKELPPRVIAIPSEKPAGKIMALIVKMAAQQPTFTNVDVRNLGVEIGLTFSNIVFNKSWAYIISQGYLVKEGNAYRLPKMVKVETHS